MANHPNRSRRLQASFTRKELDLLLSALDDRINEMAMNRIGLSIGEQNILIATINKLIKLGEFERPLLLAQPANLMQERGQ